MTHMKCAKCGEMAPVGTMTIPFEGPIDGGPFCPRCWDSFADYLDGYEQGREAQEQADSALIAENSEPDPK